ncbi:MAG: RNA polymerase sigma-70 factor [Saprospiraceae bacterium]|nr:RNA polymerase sigma-70 factor [Saprospiraceae bacterium]
MEQSLQGANEILQLILSQDPRGLTWIYTHYYQDLVRIAYQITRDVDLAEDAVQESLIYFWDRREAIQVSQSLFGYLRRMCVHRSLRKMQQENRRTELPEYKLSEEVDHDPLEYDELQSTIQEAIAALPDRCEEVFRYSREDQLTYVEIADRMGISVKTVENQMTKALRLLRDKLRDHLTIIFL